MSEFRYWVGSGANDAEWHSFHIRQPAGLGVQFWYDNNLVYEQPAEDMTYRPNSPGPVGWLLLNSTVVELTESCPICF